MNRISVVLAIVLAAGTVYATQVDVFPRDTTWTGGTYYLPSWPYWGYWWENPITWGNFFWMTTPATERGFARYALDSLPDGEPVTAAVLHYYVYADTGDPTAEVRLLSIEPFPDSEPQAQEVYDSIGTGVLVAVNNSTAPGWNAVELNGDGLAAIAERTTTTDWLGLGWSYPDTNYHDAFARGWRQDSLKTYITVSYEPTGMESRGLPHPDAATLHVTPNPSGCEAVTVRLSSPGQEWSVVTVSDAAGRVVRRLVPGDDGCLRLTALAPGLYFISASVGGSRVCARLAVLR